MERRVVLLRGINLRSHNRVAMPELATGEFRQGVDPQDFAVRLAALIDGLGKSLILRDPWMSSERMLAACTAMVETELAV